MMFIFPETAPDVAPMTRPAASDLRAAKIGCETTQSILIAHKRACRGQSGESKGHEAARSAERDVEIGCRNPQHLRFYPDRPLPWPNPS